MSNQQQAIHLCKIIEQISPDYGCHVALTGGCLYGSGERKDIDIVVYRIRQVEKIDIEGFFKALSRKGITIVSSFGFCVKAMFQDHLIDFLFPEESGVYGKQESKKDSLLPAPKSITTPQ